jgi:hypothetical protein
VNDVFCGSASFLAHVFEIGPAKLLRSDANLVVHSKSELLFAAQGVFRRLDQHVAEEELDLVELAADQMTETRIVTQQQFELGHNGQRMLLHECTRCFKGMPKPAIFLRCAFQPKMHPTVLALQTYSVRNAITGSIRIALRAGIAIAAKAVNMRMTDTPMNVSGSVGWTPKSI